MLALIALYVNLSPNVHAVTITQTSCVFCLSSFEYFPSPLHKCVSCQYSQLVTLLWRESLWLRNVLWFLSRLSPDSLFGLLFLGNSIALHFINRHNFVSSYVCNHKEMYSEIITWKKFHWICCIRQPSPCCSNINDFEHSWCESCILRP